MPNRPNAALSTSSTSSCASRTTSEYPSRSNSSESTSRRSVAYSRDSSTPARRRSNLDDLTRTDVRIEHPVRHTTERRLQRPPFLEAIPDAGQERLDPSERVGEDGAVAGDVIHDEATSASSSRVRNIGATRVFAPSPRARSRAGAHRRSTAAHSAMRSMRQSGSGSATMSTSTSESGRIV